jgi:Amiloride-sensitive sodium channel
MNTQSIRRSYCSECTYECSNTEYIIKSSASLAPPRFLLNQIKQFVESSTIPLSSNWSTSWISEIQSNYVSLEVSYENTLTDLYSQQATLSAVDVLSNVGGLSGLWLGISFLSLMEIAEMIYRLARSQFHTIRAAIQNRFRTQ